MNWKSAVRSLPVLGPLSERVWPPRAAKPFEGSASYWEERYRTGGNSGAGSYNRLAVFKAEFLNDFVARREIGSVIEFGSGDGAQLLLADYPKYIGVDVSRTAIAHTTKLFVDRPEYTFVHTSELPPGTKADLSLSLDVIYHLVEDDVFERYMRDLFEAARENVIIYATNEDKPWPDPHVRHRRFQTWIENNRPDFLFMNHVPNPYPADPADPDNTSFADFWVFQRG